MKLQQVMEISESDALCLWVTVRCTFDLLISLEMSIIIIILFFNFGAANVMDMYLFCALRMYLYDTIKCSFMVINKDDGRLVVHVLSNHPLSEIFVISSHGCGPMEIAM